jgi:hypothetical protein
VANDNTTKKIRLTSQDKKEIAELILIYLRCIEIFVSHTLKSAPAFEGISIKCRVYNNEYKISKIGKSSMLEKVFELCREGKLHPCFWSDEINCPGFAWGVQVGLEPGYDFWVRKCQELARDSLNDEIAFASLSDYVRWTALLARLNRRAPPSAAERH